MKPEQRLMGISTINYFATLSSKVMFNPIGPQMCIDVTLQSLCDHQFHLNKLSRGQQDFIKPENSKITMVKRKK